MKKVLFILTAALLVTGLMGSRPAQAAYTPMAGDLVKNGKSPAVYIVDDDLKRHLFSNEATFWTWYSGGWAAQKVKVISQDDFDVLDSGANVTARPGANLIQFDNSNKVYAVTPGRIICEVRALYGGAWQARSIMIQSSFETDYIKDTSCTVTSDSLYPNGSLIQYTGDKNIYLIDGGKKRLVSATGMTANNFHTTAVVANVPKSMVFAANSKSVSDYDYSLSILATFEPQSTTGGTTLPDLTITDITFPSAQTAVNQTIQIQLVIKNLGGNLTSSQGLSNISFVGTDFMITNISHPAYPSTIKPLATGQDFTVTYSGRFVASGQKSFTAQVNYPLQLTESNTTNNAFSKGITVYAQ